MLRYYATEQSLAGDVAGRRATDFDCSDAAVFQRPGEGSAGLQVCSPVKTAEASKWTSL